MAEQKSPHEDMILGVIVVGLTVGFLYVVWIAFHDQIVTMVKHIRLVEIAIGGVFSDQQHLVQTKTGSRVVPTSSFYDFVKNVSPSAVDFGMMQRITFGAMMPLKLFFAVILFGMGVGTFFVGPESKFQRRMGLEDLIEEQAKIFPVISPFVDFNPAKQKHRAPGDPVPRKLPLFAEALAPEEWIAFHEIEFSERKVNYPQAYNAMSKQLGPRWRGADKLPIHLQAVYAACALKYKRKRKECEALLGEIAKAWSAKSGFKPDAALKSKIRKIIANKDLGRELEKYCNKHAFQTTAMLRALNRAREEGGVLASAEFVWLRGFDRTTWYPLNNLGRKSYHAEAAGALSHYTHELIAGQKIPTPRFDDVIKALNKTLGGVEGRPIPKLVKE